MTSVAGEIKDCKLTVLSHDFGVPLVRVCLENFGGSAILATMHTLTGSSGEYFRVVTIHSDG